MTRRLRNTLALTAAAGAVTAAAVIGATAAQSTPAPAPYGRETADVANDALTAAMNKVGAHIKAECAHGAKACDTVQGEVKGLGLEWGKGWPVAFHADGTWEIE